MKIWLSVKIFTVVSAAVYILGFIFDREVFKYYPLINTFSRHALDHEAGPAMNYYGWITQGLLAGLTAGLVALAIPRTWGDRVWSGVIWLAPAIAILTLLPYEIHWFTDG